MHALTEIRIFLPWNLNTVQWLYGLKRYRNWKGDLTVTVLGGTEDRMMHDNLLKDHMDHEYTKYEDEDEEISLEWVGCCCSETDTLSKPPSSSFWMKWMIDAKELHLDTIDVAVQWDGTTPVKVRGGGYERRT